MGNVRLKQLVKGNPLAMMSAYLPKYCDDCTHVYILVCDHLLA